MLAFCPAVNFELFAHNFNLLIFDFYVTSFESLTLFLSWELLNFQEKEKSANCLEAKISSPVCRVILYRSAYLAWYTYLIIIIIRSLIMRFLFDVRARSLYLTSEVYIDFV